MKIFSRIFWLLFVALSCTSEPQNQEKEEAETATEVPNKIPVVFDTDANNELDDQHAMAYLFTNQDVFDIRGVTVNATKSGGNIDRQYDEAERILTLFNLNGKIPLLKGANGSFLEIEPNIGNAAFDGSKAVDFIIEEAEKCSEENKLVLIAVGKLTNVALALERKPSIESNIRLVWLGSNFPDPGEYNLENDIPSMNYVLHTNVDFEIVTVRYGKESGTDAVKITQADVNKNMPGLGPKIKTPIVGRHGGEFDNFGDYSVNLFEHISYHGDPPARALFDMAAVAIVKNPNWAKSYRIPGPTMKDGQWLEQPDNSRKVRVWEDFKKDEIIADLYAGLKAQ
ncbi:nucleoside hydrolase [Marinilongibacter aquaticus]|uniref:nucleoside hydrolase n=1 Tax=Marinilongibacter aquaticus TaxID=2975157 RepID=UPI0021BD4991|nr:nucleoside hydrolase [Marinilongibacter aquaticus]UBM59784.1 nucleoside hydrolase [Marinilongibacter aquaticus]